jgi:hypothetical protein
MALSALMFLWWRRRRANAELAQSNGRQVHGELTPMSELDGRPITTRPSQKPELDARDTNITRESTRLVPVELPNKPESNALYEISGAPRENDTHP